MRHSDERLGRALRELEVPEHDGSFFGALEEAMRESDRMTVQEEEYRMARGTKTRKGRRWGRLLLPAAAAALLIAALVVGPLRPLLPDDVSDTFGPGIATAAEVQAEATQAVARAQAISGTLVVVDAARSAGSDGTTMRYEFVSTARGDVRLSGANQLEDGTEVVEERAYDASTRTEVGYSIGSDGAGSTMGWKRSGLAPGLPDQAPSDLIGSHFGDIVVALAQAQDPTVREDTYEGRDAWVLSADVEPNLLADGAPDHVEVTVDQATGFPVRVIRSADGTLVQEVRLEGLEVDPDISADAFSLTVPEGVEYYESDAGFREVARDDAAAVVGYEPLLPAWLPEGFELSELTVAEEAYPTGKEGGNPVSRGVVSALYRRGFHTLLVTTRYVGDDLAAWSDPLSLGEGYIDRPEKVGIDSGAFAGTTAERALDARGVPHIWTMNDVHVVTVSGSLSGDELLQVAESIGQ